MSSCTKQQIYQAIANWAGVPVSQLNDSTILNGLGGKNWPQDAPALISSLEDVCQCTISQQIYDNWVTVEDIDDYLLPDDSQ